MSGRWFKADFLHRAANIAMEQIVEIRKQDFDMTVRKAPRSKVVWWTWQFPFRMTRPQSSAEVIAASPFLQLEQRMLKNPKEMRSYNRMRLLKAMALEATILTGDKTDIFVSTEDYEHLRFGIHRTTEWLAQE